MENWHIIENDSGSQWQTHELKPYNFAALFWGSTRIQTTGGKINKTMHIMIWLIWPYKTNKLACRHSNAPFWPAVAHIKLLDYWKSWYLEQLMSILHGGNWFQDMKYTCVSKQKNKTTRDISNRIGTERDVWERGGFFNCRKWQNFFIFFYYKYLFEFNNLEKKLGPWISINKKNCVNYYFGDSKVNFWSNMYKTFVFKCLALYCTFKQSEGKHSIKITHNDIMYGKRLHVR